MDPLFRECHSTCVFGISKRVWSDVVWGWKRRPCCCFACVNLYWYTLRRTACKKHWHYLIPFATRDGSSKRASFCSSTKSICSRRSCRIPPWATTSQITLGKHAFLLRSRPFNLLIFLLIAAITMMRLVITCCTALWASIKALQANRSTRITPVPQTLNRLNVSHFACWVSTPPAVEHYRLYTIVWGLQFCPCWRRFPPSCVIGYSRHPSPAASPGMWSSLVNILLPSWLISISFMRTHIP